MKWIFKYCWLIMVCSCVKAQNNPLIYAAKIEFEKRTNVHAIIDDMIKSDPVIQRELEDRRKGTTQFYTESFTLCFNKATSLYRQTGSAGKIPFLFLKNLAVYLSLEAKTRLSEREIAGEKFIVRDSVRKIQWRITNETRTIAGFECRRANALIFDSVYVVAFFAGDIVPSGGPDIFNGLPGMILQVNLPHEHISWTAQSVSLETDPATQLVPPAGKKIMTATEYNNMVDQLSGKNSVIKQFIKKQLAF